ncbi:MAG: hypothetical protein QXE05_12300 [Nitrososphaeria archaeon]
MGYKSDSEENKRNSMRDICYDLTFNCLFALLLWLFGVLVFVPIAETISANVKLLITIIIFIPFTIIVLRFFPKILNLIELLTVFSTKRFKYLKNFNENERFLFFKSIYTILFAILIYFLYFPLLTNFHPAINGVAVIVLTLSIFFILFRILRILLK